MFVTKKSVFALLLLGLVVAPQGPEARRLSMAELPRRGESADLEGVRFARAGAGFIAMVAVVKSREVLRRDSIKVNVPSDLRIDKTLARKIAELEADPSMAVPLNKELKGFVKVTSGDYRMVLRWSALNEMTLVDFGARGSIYGALARRLSESIKQSRISGVMSESARLVEESARILHLREGVVRI